MMDAVTAVAGSGPAYVFAFTRALAQAGEAQGLPPAVAAHRPAPRPRATTATSTALVAPRAMNWRVASAYPV